MILWWNEMKLFISNDTIKIIKSWEYLTVLVDGIIETVKHEMKKQFLEALLAPLNASLMQPVISSAVIAISGRWVKRSGRAYVDKMF